jgi:hypothetical protein
VLAGEVLGTVASLLTVADGAQEAVTAALAARPTRWRWPASTLR